MQDQVMALQAKNIRANYLGSAQEDKTVFSRALNGEFQILYCTPERAVLFDHDTAASTQCWTDCSGRKPLRFRVGSRFPRGLLGTWKIARYVSASSNHGTNGNRDQGYATTNREAASIVISMFCCKPHSTVQILFTVFGINHATPNLLFCHSSRKTTPPLYMCQLLQKSTSWFKC